MKVKRYQLDSIVSRTKKNIQPIRRGEEDTPDYFEYLAILEIQMDRFHREYNLNGRQAMEIIEIVLLDINALLSGEEYDYSGIKEENYQECINEIEELFIPSKNSKLQSALGEEFIPDENFYEFARKILVRIHESIEHWTKACGSNGYFNFISGYIGGEIITTKKYLVEDVYLK